MVVQTNEILEEVIERVDGRFINILLDTIVDEYENVLYKYEQIEIDRFASDEAVVIAVEKLKKEIARKSKVATLSTITVEVNGKVFDGNETARVNMNNAILVAGLVGQTEAEWKLADNTVAVVTLEEIKQALALSIQRVGEIVRGY